MDWYSRFILSWKISTTLDVNFVLEAAEEALLKYGNPEIENSDQGTHYTSEQHILISLPISVEPEQVHAPVASVPAKVDPEGSDVDASAYALRGARAL